LTTIFGDSDYVKGNFFDILNGLVSSQDQELAKEFIEVSQKRNILTLNLYAMMTLTRKTPF